MVVSLREWLATGRLDGLRQDITKTELEALLGPPDDTGGTLSDGRPPAIYVYRDLQIFFRADDRLRAISVMFESRRGDPQFRLPEGWSGEDWSLRPGRSRARVRRYLERSAIAFREVERTNGMTFRFITEPTGAAIVFDDSNRLHSIGAELPP
jgi:hypothetical protein